MSKFLRQTALVWLVALVALNACRCDGQDSDDQDEPVEEQTAEEVEETEERVEEIFGLPVPPGYSRIRYEEHRVRVTVAMELEELVEFFEPRMPDHEVVRLRRHFSLVPLRSGSASVRGERLGQRSGPFLLTYRQPVATDHVVFQEPPLEVAERTSPVPEQVDEPPAAQARPTPPPAPAMVTTGGPEWLDEIRGEPVELLTPEGELLAPGARWGEPYTPPKGSPLHTERNRPNFGRPFGDWRGR